MECKRPCRGFCDWIATLPVHVVYTMPKDSFPALPDCFRETLLGEVNMDACRQLRGPHGSHVHEYRDRWVLHRDRVDAEKDPLGHLVSDAPEWLVSTLIGLVVCAATGGRHAKGRALLVGGLAGAFTLVSGKVMKLLDGDSAEGDGRAPGLK